MKNSIIGCLIVIFISITFTMEAQRNKSYPYETVPGDPLKARIYTLDNGLKVYLSVYRDAPRIQTYIAVRVGSKNDPAETTGLAHYFEHMMFKGTEDFGTRDWAAEKPLIDRIDSLFEVYRKEKDEAKRAAIYREIDSLSFEASKYAISNEYDKMMDAIGSQGSNAGTSNDYTIYMENIPSNELENWSKIEADRFSKPVLRLFHTEVETVYEEKNRSLTNDSRKVSETTLKLLFPNHPYGQQTTLGESAHLKNPSMKNIREFFAKFYVPNNMALCMAGDLDPDSAIRVIDRYFGSLKPGSIPTLAYGAWKPLTAPVTDTITGLEAENVRVSFGFDIPASDRETALLRMIGMILYNGKAGLIDLNLNQKQAVLSANGYFNILNDYSYLSLSGRPRSGQSLQEVRDLLLKQVELLKRGEFPDWMLEAAVNNLKLAQIRQAESNQGRAMAMADAYLSLVPWKQSVEFLDDIGKIRKKDIVDFARKNLGKGYVVIFKEQGTPEAVDRIPKPPITPIQINYTDESEFSRNIRKSQVTPIEPVFVDYSRDLYIRYLPSGLRIIANCNTEDEVFTLTYYFRLGRNSDKKLSFALSLLPFLGTPEHDAASIRQEFYRLGCDVDISARDEESSITLSGLGSSFGDAVALLEELITGCLPDSQALENLVKNILKTRSDLKSGQQDVFNALVSYGTYGPDSPFKNIIPAAELTGLTAEELVASLHSLTSYQHDLLYYGPMTGGELEVFIGNACRLPGKLVACPPMVRFLEQPTDSNRVFFVNYDARQTRLQTIIKEFPYDPSMMPEVSLFDYYMSNLSFQELREKRALAYTAYSRFQAPVDLKRSFLAVGFIGTQSDKMMTAFTALNDLYDRMPLSDAGFRAAKDALISKIRTERITKMNLVWNFLDAERHGLNYDLRKTMFEQIPNLEISSIKEFDEKYLKNRPKTYLVLGREQDMDFKGLGQLGPVTRLKLEDIFGY